jgi:hypothetical protein
MTIKTALLAMNAQAASFFELPDVAVEALESCIVNLHIHRGQFVYLE